LQTCPQGNFGTQWLKIIVTNSPNCCYPHKHGVLHGWFGLSIFLLSIIIIISFHN